MNSTTPIAPRSTLLSVIAWLFILVGAFTTLASMIQGLMYVRMLSMPMMHQAMHEGAQHMPFLLQLLFEHFRLYLSFVFSLSFATLISAIGLLKRNDPSRRVFITVLIVVILALLAAFITQLSIRPATDNIPTAQIPAEAKTMMRAMKGFFFIITFSISCLFGWLIAFLTAPDTKREFTKTDGPPAS
ncbi:MAG: hypothetical protein OEV73_09375 [Desulfobulbaceae bacterium]|nr:hypothetical protein [Desulfobulbaceae bacterium]